MTDASLPPAAPNDWAAIAASPSFRTLLRERRNLGFALTALTLVVYFTFFLADALVPDVFGRPLAGFGSVGLLLVLLMFVFSWLAAWYYLHRANTSLAVLQDRVRCEHLARHGEPR